MCRDTDLEEKELSCKDELQATKNDLGNDVTTAESYQHEVFFQRKTDRWSSTRETIYAIEPMLSADRTLEPSSTTWITQWAWACVSPDLTDPAAQRPSDPADVRATLYPNMTSATSLWR
jgi:hypothetical protein